MGTNDRKKADQDLRNDWHERRAAVGRYQDHRTPKPLRPCISEYIRLFAMQLADHLYTQ